MVFMSSWRRYVYITMACHTPAFHLPTPCRLHTHTLYHQLHTLWLVSLFHCSLDIKTNIQFINGEETHRFITLKNHHRYWAHSSKECVCCVGRLKIEELEGERQRLEEQNNVLELRLERHNLQVGTQSCVWGLDIQGCSLAWEVWVTHLSIIHVRDDWHLHSKSM